ncbi:hypothetical protein [Leuconostoc mesenteroides]|uniref:hypothetical protein n=1 Tax=Leuconostoc mesenteroides TaxID=1245 RepID=UPI003993AAD9
MRVVSADPDAAALMGININHPISFTFAIGSTLFVVCLGEPLLPFVIMKLLPNP